VANQQNSLPESAPIRRRPWWRFFAHFSVRTLLLVTTFAAVACWWFLRPKTREEQLAGKHLQLHREVRLEEVDSKAQLFAGANVQTIGGKRFLLVNAGRWQLRDDQDNLLVAGHCANDQPSGKWTIYHVNGRKAAEGDTYRGARRGLWRTWDEEGRLETEIIYEAREQELVFRKPVGPEMLARLPWKSFRHGPARGWHPNGKLQFEGQYEDDRREGQWTFYDNEGRVATRSDYENDKIKSHAEAQRRGEESK